MRIAGRVVLALVVGAPFLACGDDIAGPGGSREAVAKVEVAPDAHTLTALGDAVRLVAVVRDADGDVIRGVTCTWESSDSRVATVDASGLVTGVGNGRATVAATCEGVRGLAILVVRQVISIVQVVPGADSLTALGDTVRLVAVPSDANGHAIARTACTWQSSDSRVVRVDSAGVVTAVGIGRTTVVATCDGVDGSATLSVGPLGLVFAAQPSYAGDCRNRPSRSVCLGFDDGYIWLVYDAVAGWGEHGTWEGHRIISAAGFKARYYHVLGTDLVFERPY